MDEIQPGDTSPQTNPEHGPDPLQLVSLIPGERVPHHTNVLYPPHGAPVLVADTVPLGKLAGRYWCKYCYRTHTAWWMMDQAAYAVADLLIILCGYCEHTTGIGTDGNQTWWDAGAFDLPDEETSDA